MERKMITILTIWLAISLWLGCRLGRFLKQNTTDKGMK